MNENSIGEDEITLDGKRMPHKIHKEIAENMKRIKVCFEFDSFGCKFILFHKADRFNNTKRYGIRAKNIVNANKNIFLNKLESALKIQNAIERTKKHNVRII